MTRMEARIARIPTVRVAARQEALRAIIDANGPLTVRRAFYIAVSAGVYPKTEHGYELVVEDSNVLRDQGAVGYEAIIDPTRIVRQAGLWPSPASVARYYARHLRLDPWYTLPCRLAITVESDGLALALFEHLVDTPLRIVAVRGNGSSSAVASLAEWLSDAPEDAVILHVGDADGQGLAIEEDLRSRLALHARRLGGPLPRVERVWLSRQQAIAHALPSRPAKLTPMDLKYGFFEECWEAEAGDPALIAGLIRVRADDLLDGVVLDAVAERERVARIAFADFARLLEAA
jgi:hypothetical protein